MSPKPVLYHENAERSKNTLLEQILSSEISPVFHPSCSTVHLNRSMAQPDFANLAARLQQSMTSRTQEISKEEVYQMSYEELGQCIIKFGEAHVGKRYEELIPETRYVTWFASRYKDSPKIEHVKFLRFLQLHVEKLEKTDAENPKKSQTKNKETYQPKAKVAPKTSIPHTEIEDDDEDTWSRCESPKMSSPDQTEFMALQNRLAQMETMMQQVLMHLSQSQGVPPP